MFLLFTSLQWQLERYLFLVGRICLVQCLLQFYCIYYHSYSCHLEAFRIDGHHLWVDAVKFTK